MASKHRKPKKERAAKVALERFNRILQLIRHRGRITMRELQEELEVSRESVKRDIEFLRDRLECPLRYDAGAHAWVLENDGKFELPGMWFDASEILALLAMSQLLDGIQPGLLAEHITPVRERLRRAISSASPSPSSLADKVKVIHFAPRQVQPRHFRIVANALFSGLQLSLRYWNRDKREDTTRTISPLQLVHYRDNWILDAWCHKRSALRSFALDAMREVATLATPAVVVSAGDLSRHFESGYGIFAGQASEWAVLQFSPDRAQFVSLETWHPRQRSRWLPDGSFVLEVPYSNDQELVMDLLRHGKEVIVLQPDALRRATAGALRAAAARYAL